MFLSTTKFGRRWKKLGKHCPWMLPRGYGPAEDCWAALRLSPGKIAAVCELSWATSAQRWSAVVSLRKIDKIAFFGVALHKLLLRSRVCLDRKGLWWQSRQSIILGWVFTFFLTPPVLDGTEQYHDRHRSRPSACSATMSVAQQTSYSHLNLSASNLITTLNQTKINFKLLRGKLTN